MVSQRLSLVGATCCLRLGFLGGVFKARPLIIEIARFDSVVDFEPTVEGVDVDGEDLRRLVCFLSGVRGQGGTAADDFPDCRDFFLAPCFDAFADGEFEFAPTFSATRRRKAADFDGFDALGMTR